MREMKDSGIRWMGDIPSDWNVERVKHGFVRKKEEAHQENPIVLSLARAGVKVRDISNNEGQIAESYYNYNPVDVDDLLINPMDLYSGANCSISKIKGVISPAYINLRYRDGHNPNYYDYYFKVQYWIMAFFAHGKGVSYENRWTLNAETLMNYPIIVPSYNEQCRIVKYLDSKCFQIDAIIKKQQVIIEKLKEYKLSIITEAVTKGLKPDVTMKDSGVEWFGEIPETCKVTRSGHIYDIILGKMLSPEPKDEDDTLEKYYCAANVHFDGVINNDLKTMWFSEREKKQYLVELGDLLVVEGGAGAGGSAILLESNDNDVYVQNSIMIVRGNAIVDNWWLYYTLYSLVKRNYIDFVCNKATIPHFTKEKLGNVPVVLFPDDEKTNIVNYLNVGCKKIDKTIEDRNKAIEKLQEYKKSLIYEVVTGKKEV